MGRRLPLVAAAFAGMVFLGGVAQAGNDPTAAAGAPAASGTPSPASELPLVLSIRALSIGPPTFPQAPEVETGEIARGVYLHVSPVCIPGVDEPFEPSGRRHPRRR
jgi:hypothetical protein